MFKLTPTTTTYVGYPITCTVIQSVGSPKWNIDLSCPIIENDKFIKNMCIVILNSVLFLTLFVS